MAHPFPSLEDQKDSYQAFEEGGEQVGGSYQGRILQRMVFS